VAAAALALVTIVAVASGSLFGASPSPSPLTGLASPTAPVASPEPAVSGGDASATPPGASGSPSPGASDPGASPSPTDAAPQPDAKLAVAPVVPFRSGRTAIKAADVASIATGSSPFKGLVLVQRDADGILASLGLKRSALGSRLVTVASARALATDLASHPTHLGFLRADEVGPSVRAVSWNGKSLFGEGRVKSLASWPLTATLPGRAPDSTAYNPAKAWTMFAGGDILLDRGVSLAIRAHGVNYPFDGGTAQITGRCRNCSPMGWDLPVTRRTGSAGAVRDLISGADLAIANFENPAPNRFSFHDHGTIFSANPAYIQALKDAGIDWVSNANNHVGDQGRTGVVQTMANLDKYGIKHGGAGLNATQAHTATLMKVGGVTVGILGYDYIAPRYNATATEAGSARISQPALKADIKKARAAGADVVIVFPHWGIEYRAQPSAVQQQLGHAAIDAGADMVIGNHPHWAEGMEVYKGKPIWYALGNLVFDQDWSEQTMEGITLELTFNGKTLVQARIRPHVLLGKSQANFLDPAGSGKAVMDQVWNASKGRLPW
jgi:poly-gamma-glutamate capsule biosynthesis protein CapA/YwtB (metallophosphatase superfamily)